MARRFGDYYWHVVNIEPTLDAGGKVASWTGIAVNIDDNKRAEKDLREGEAQYRKELSRSTSFQRALLPPHLPSVPGLTFDAIYEPGSSDENVGGD